MDKEIEVILRDLKIQYYSGGIGYITPNSLTQVSKKLKELIESKQKEAFYEAREDVLTKYTQQEWEYKYDDFEDYKEKTKK